jgi:hypothetical protein
MCRFLPGKKPEKLRYEEWVSVHLDNEHEPDGRFYEYPHSEGDEWYDNLGLSYEVSMALPLVEIASADDLKRKVLSPLLEQASKVSEASVE